MGWLAINCRSLLGGLATAAALALPWVAAAEAPETPAAVVAAPTEAPETTPAEVPETASAAIPEAVVATPADTPAGGDATAGAEIPEAAPAAALEADAGPAEPAEGAPSSGPVAAYQALAASQWRNYDRRQDISPRQLVILLEVAERTGSSLGQALATGEHESARTWNDHIRPTLKSGSLGAATGVWQFMPGTFHHIVHKFGTRMLAASDADPASGRGPLDLGYGPFTDAQVRDLIRDTVEGRRGADDQELQLLRHNFAVLAFAKHYLSLDNGAATPEEDYLFHFLGAGEGRRILALARGEARHTLSVKPAAPATPAQDPASGPMVVVGAGSAIPWDLGPPSLPMFAAGPEPLSAMETQTRSSIPAESAPRTLPAADGKRTAQKPPSVANGKKTAQKPASVTGGNKTAQNPPTRPNPSVAARPARPAPPLSQTQPPLNLDLRRGSGPSPLAGNVKAANARTADGKAAAKKPTAAKKTQPPPASALALTLPGSPGVPPVSLRLRSEPSDILVLERAIRPALKPAAARPPSTWVTPEPARYSAPSVPPLASAPWGLPADSPTVTGNLGMFYRDGKGQTQPYTWAEFLQHLGRRVRAADQAALVRAKYGVGFPLKGGDMPGRAYDPDRALEAVEFGSNQAGRPVRLPEDLVIGTLDQDEARRYKARLAELAAWGEDEATATLPPEALSALHLLGVLPAAMQKSATAHPQVQKALADFRQRVGKNEPDDPDHAGLLLPAERAALEIYGQRLNRHARVQAAQQDALDYALDLNRVGKLPPRLQRSAAPLIAAVQTALAERGLLTPPTQKVVTRDKKRKKQVSYKTIPFPGKPDKATVDALNAFQLRHGLWRTGGALDPITLALLDLPPVGLEVFAPPSGPQCPIADEADAPPRCEIKVRTGWTDLRALIPTPLRRVRPSGDALLGSACWGPLADSAGFGPLACGTPDGA